MIWSSKMPWLRRRVLLRLPDMYRVSLFCNRTQLVLSAMGKRGTVEGVCMGSLTDSMTTLEATGDINHFRDRARELGVAIKHRNAEGIWVHRRKEDMVKDCRQQLKQSHPDVESRFQGRDAIRALAVQLGVERYKTSDTPGRSIWRKTADHAADCDAALQLAKETSLQSPFGQQLKFLQAPGSESDVMQGADGHRR